MNCAKMIRYGFRPRGRHSLVGEVGSHTTQYSTCHVVISAICIKEAELEGSGTYGEKGGFMEEEESYGGRILACLPGKCSRPRKPLERGEKGGK